MKGSTSIQTQWTLLMGAILAVTLLSLGSLAWYRGHQARMQAVDRELQERLNLLISAFRPRPGERLESIAQPRFSNRGQSLFQTDEFYYVLWKAEGEKQSHSENAPSLKAPNPEAGRDGLRDRDSSRERWQITPTGRCFLVGKFLKSERAQSVQDLRVLGGAGFAILLLGWSMAWGFSKRWVRPLKALGRTAKAIASGDLSQRAPLPVTQDELHEVVTVLNETFERLDQAFQREKRFTADAAHELKTPLSTLLIHAQSALKYPQSEEETRETFVEIERAAKRMHRLLDHLLELSRWDAGVAPLHRQDVDLASLLRETLKEVQALEEARVQQFNLDLASIHLSGEPIRLRQVFQNLLLNAIHHTPAGGQIRMRMVRQAETCRVSILNTGSFIPETHLPHIFDRFYRTDTARSRAAGGAGLGLSIALAIVEAHGGRIEVSSRAEEGTCFTVILPLGE